MDIKKIGDRIKQARTLRNYTLDDIASDIGVAKSTIQRYENGLISKPKLPVLQAIADSLRVNPAWISGQEVSMISDDSLSSILNCRLNEIGMTLEEVSKKSNVSFHWLQHLETFTPGGFGPDEIGYAWITKVAEVVGLPGGTLRAALAKQEMPTYEGPISSAEEAFKQNQEVFKNTNIKDNLMAVISKNEKDHINKYRFIDEKGRHTVDTVLEMEYNRCKSDNGLSVIPIHAIKDHLIPNAAHERTDIEVTEEMKKHDDAFFDE
jgi:DNA-binding XRE family transcriptional regulator